MMLRKSLFLGLVIGFASVFSLTQSAEAQTARVANALPVAKVDQIWPVLDQQQRTMVDLLAADFFQNDLAEEQRLRIIASRAEAYRRASPEMRDQMRREGRRDWDHKGSDAAGMTFDRLSDRQKAPFRRQAIEELGLEAPAPVHGAAARNHV